MTKLTNDPASSPLRVLLARWLGIYPSITVMLLLLGPYLLGKIPTPLITLILTALLVPLTHYLVFPLIERLSRHWVIFPVQQGHAHHRMAVVIWAVTYPLITVVLLLVLTVMHGQPPIPLLTFIVTIIAVPLQSLVLLPAVIPRVIGWIQRA